MFAAVVAAVPAATTRTGLPVRLCRRRWLWWQYAVIPKMSPRAAVVAAVGLRLVWRDDVVLSRVQSSHRREHHFHWGSSVPVAAAVAVVVAAVVAPVVVAVVVEGGRWTHECDVLQQDLGQRLLPA